MTSRLRTALCRVLLSMLTLLPATAHAASVTHFQPLGQVELQTRASARFDADMVALGDTDAAAPFDVACGAVGGHSYWVDARTWTWQLERPLAVGERCVFTRRAGLKAQDGSLVSGNERFEFFASGPFPRRIQPAAGDRINPQQIFVIDAGAAIDEASAQAHIWCEAEGVGQRIAVRPALPAQRAEIQQHLRGLSPHPLMLSCSERLPAGSKVKLVWGKGVRTVGAGGTAEASVVSTRERSFAYQVHPPLRATLACEREKADAACSPLGHIRVEFSSPVALKTLMNIRLGITDAQGKVVQRAPQDPNTGDATRIDSTTSIHFLGPFAPGARMILTLPADLRDLDGQPLENAARFPLKFTLGALPPLAKFPGRFGILELKEGGLLPVTLRHVEAALATAKLQLPGAHRFAEQHLGPTDGDADVIAAMRALARFERQTRKVMLKRPNGSEEEVIDPWYARELSFLAHRQGVSRQALPKPGGSAEFEVVGIPLVKPGYHIVEIESRLLGAALLAQPAPMYVRSAALVTNLAVHLKRGRDNALVWVTTLDRGQPAAGAEVRVTSCAGRELWRGKTDAQGRAAIDRPLDIEPCQPPPGSPARPNHHEEIDDEEMPFLLASARLGDDFSFVRSDWTEGIEPWRFGIETWGEVGDFKIHTLLDRTLLRPGQTLSMKHIARLRNSRGFGYPDAASLPDTLTLRHTGDGTEYSQPVSWDARGTATSTWLIPAAARLGNYEVSLSGGSRGMTSSAQFRLADFRLPVYTGSLQGPATRLVAPLKVPLAASLSFLNGGAAKGAAVQVSATLRPRWPEYPAYNRFNFHIDFDDKALAAFGIAANRERERLVLDRQALQLDARGTGKLEIALPAAPKGPSELYAEMSFNDPNGEVQTLHGSVTLWPAAVALGIHVRDWASTTGDSNSVELVTLDLQGKPLPGQEIVVRGKRRIDYSHRRRVVGGFYTYEHSSEYVDLGVLCRGMSDARGIYTCSPKTKDSGSILLLAETRDAHDHIARASTSYWVTGAGDAWMTTGNQDRIDLIPEQRSYKAGDTARLQVRTPFREATALIGIEAGGIIETFVQPLSRFDPVIKLPVKGSWGPNVYVSVLVVRGRIEPLKWYSFFQWGWREPLAWFRDWWQPQQPSAMVDLAKPAFRVGLTEIEVDHDAFRLNVAVQPEKTDYRPRDQARVKLQVSTADGKPAPAGSELAFVAVDQALLELKPNDTWGLLEAMLQKRPHEVETATAQSQVIGKRHFGKKALPPGGGGGRGPARELFDTLLTWQPRVILDARGQATVTVPMNDALSEFRLVGIATSGPGLFGTGSALLRTRQDLQLISGLPPLVREKDRYQAMLTVRNGTSRAMQIQVDARAGDQPLDSRQLTLAAESSQELAWPVQAPAGQTSLAWEFSAREQGAQATSTDRLKLQQDIAPAVPLTVQQATLLQLNADGPPQDMAVSLPPGALPGKGGIEISLAARQSSPPPGLRRFFEHYPYTCLEQKASVAIGLRPSHGLPNPTTASSYPRWDEIVALLPAHLDRNGLAHYFPSDGPGSVALTAYLLDISQAAGLPLPATVETQMRQGLLAFAEGRLKSSDWAPAAIGSRSDAATERRLMALAAASRADERLNPALTRVANALDIDPAQLSTAALIDWLLLQKRLSALPNRLPRLAQTQQALRNRLDYASGRLVFTSETSDGQWWRMVSTDLNAFRLIEAVLDDPAWQADLPRLLRGALERQSRGHWATTTANAWASVVLQKYGDRFEHTPVSGLTQASLGKTRTEHRWPAPAQASSAAPAPLGLPWPADPSARLVLSHTGSGQPWAQLQVLAAVPANATSNAGYRIRRSLTRLTPPAANASTAARRGDLWRVTLDIEAERDMNWVVVDDPIPAGARILGDGLGRDTSLAKPDEPGEPGKPTESTPQIWPSFIERRFDAYRAYYEMLPRGHLRLHYTMRLNNAGSFALPPSRVEALYAPEIHGSTPGTTFIVSE
jgi:uncharacterized protein YfaS (alpha-2-macroglobulin family)